MQYLLAIHLIIIGCEEIKSLSQVQNLARLELLTIQLQHQAGQLITYSNLSKKLRVSDQTVRRWIILTEFSLQLAFDLSYIQHDFREIANICAMEIGFSGKAIKIGYK